MAEPWRCCAVLVTPSVPRNVGVQADFVLATLVDNVATMDPHSNVPSSAPSRAPSKVFPDGMIR